MNCHKLLAGLSAVTFVSACTTTPVGTISYYFPKAETQVVVTQTLSCNAKGDTLHEVVTVTPTTVYSSDLSIKPAKFTPKSLDGSFSDTDIGFTFTDDGRLSGVNSTTTGQGGTILKDILGVAKAAGLAAAAGPGTLSASAACKIIADAAGKSADKAKPADAKDAKDKPAAAGDAPPTLTLTYAGLFQYARTGDDGKGPLGIKSDTQTKPGASLQLTPDASSTSLVRSLKQHIPHLEFDVEISAAPAYAAPKWEGGDGKAILLSLNSAAEAHLAVKGPIGDLSTFDTVWKGVVPVPLSSEADQFTLPIPKASLFGTHKFVLGLSSYGTIDKLEYSNTGASDAADAFGSLGSAVGGALKKPTDAEQASQVQSQADLIYQHQRLVICQADESKCPGK